jgi:tagatose 6-phosphate kinase
MGPIHLKGTAATCCSSASILPSYGKLVDNAIHREVDRREKIVLVVQCQGVICVGAYPALQRTLVLPVFEPGAVNRIGQVCLSTAGKAVNAARALHCLGEVPLLVGFCGGASGQEAQRLLQAEGIDASGLLETAMPMRICQTILPATGGAFTELVEEGPVLPGSDWQALAQHVRRLEAAVPGGRALILAGTMPEHAPVDFYAGLARAAKGPVLVDTSGAALRETVRAGTVMVKINAAELHASCGQDDCAGDILALSRGLIGAGAAAVGVTQGGDDAFLVTVDGAWGFRVPRVDVVSALGSGDSVNAGFMAGILSGQALQDAFAWGLACGTANAETAQPGRFALDRVQALYQGIVARRIG